ncbi:class I SAM-dependent methyltransferase [Kribbella sancticallisti]
MTTPLQSITEANRASWNQIAPARHGQPADFFKSGGLVLEDFEQELAGDVRGKRILQLACSCGDEVLSWANLGATATGIDISEVAIQLAQQKATAAGIDADFRQADMYDLPPDLTNLDLIYLSWGAICWAPDLNLLAQSLTTCLSSGGSILIADHHPIWEVLAVRNENHLTVTADYFGRTIPRPHIDDAKLPVGARGTDDPPPFTAFIWPTSDVVMALLTAGLRLDTFTESPAPDLYPTLGPTASHLPAYYVIKATKP